MQNVFQNVQHNDKKNRETYAPTPHPPSFKNCAINLILMTTPAGIQQLSCLFKGSVSQKIERGESLNGAESF